MPEIYLIGKLVRTKGFIIEKACRNDAMQSLWRCRNENQRKIVR